MENEEAINDQGQQPVDKNDVETSKPSESVETSKSSESMETSKPSDSVETSKTSESLDTSVEAVEREDKPVNENGLQEQQPVDDNNDKTAVTESTETDANTAVDKTNQTTRGNKRKFIEADKPDKASESTKSAEQKENVNSKESKLKAVEELNDMGKGKRARIPNKRYSDIILTPNRKSTASKSMDPFDNKSASQQEEESTSLEGDNKKTKDTLQDIKYLKPFKYGWKRELVWRSTSNSQKKIGDIYYYSPDGKKLRSLREIADNLNNKNLTLDNFSFSKESLGIDDPEKEIVRTAKYGKNSDSTSEDSVNSPAPSPIPKKTEGKRAKKATSPKSAGSEMESAKATPSRRRAAAVGMASLVEKEKEGIEEFSSSGRKASRMGSRRIRTPAAKKPKLATKSDETTEENTSSTQKTTTLRTRSSQNSANVAAAAPSKKQRNLKLKSIAHATTADDKTGNKFMDNYLQNVCFGYNTLLHIFQYLKVQDLLRAGRVCTMWRDIASHPILWRTVRMKNSQVHSFEGLANTLKKHGTTYLDLRKMLLPSANDEIWPQFTDAIAKVDTLRKIELCRCPANVVEQLAVSNPNLEVVIAVTIKCESMNLDTLRSFETIRELRLKSTSGFNVKSIDALKELTTLKTLSLTSVNELHKLNLDALAELTGLESLDLGECTNFPKTFGTDVLAKLANLEKLRLEKGQGACHTFDILNAVKDLPRLEQLELVNFDIKSGFDRSLGACQNLKKLMIIPTYISQSATTNNMVLSGVLRLQGNLTHFVWGVTLELLRVTELFVDQCEDSTNNKKEKKITGNADSIPVLKPVPDLTNGGEIPLASDPPQVEILPLPNLQKLLLGSLPTTRVKILKIPFHATWRQTLTDSV